MTSQTDVSRVKQFLITTGLASVLLFASGSAEARLGAKIEELKKERLLSQFAINALIKGSVSLARVYELTPLGTNAVGQMKIKLQFDRDERLLHAELLISKQYQAEDPSAAKRLAAFFLLTQVPFEDTTAIKPLTTEAEYRTEDPNHHVLGEVPVLPAKPTQGYQAIMGRATYSQTYRKSKLKIDKIKADGEWTRIRLESK